MQNYAHVQTAMKGNRKSVVSDFVAAMEEVNGKSLKEFFAKWVYLHPLITRSIKTKSSPY